MRTLLLGLLLGCAGKGEPFSETDTDADADADADADTDADTDAEIDSDGDGYPAGADCDDGDALVNPGALEVCDGADNDCDGSVDGDAVDAPVWYFDVDGDGYGGASIPDCDPLPTYVSAAGDCDDADPAINPGAAEICGDATDQDCDGVAQAADPACAEVCDDGHENDGDGLLDCEDGGCAGEPACQEGCEDGGDDDYDGLTDCDDDDCWGELACMPKARSWVTSGAQVERVTREEASERCSWESHFLLFGSQATELYYARSIQGRVEVETDSGTASCGWSVQTATYGYYERMFERETFGVVSVERESSFLTFSGDFVRRQGFAIDPDCPIQTSGFLPDQLWRGWAISVTIAPGYASWPPLATWYDGGTRQVVSTAQTYARGADLCSAFAEEPGYPWSSSYAGREIRSPIGAGGVYSAIWE